MCLARAYGAITGSNPSPDQLRQGPIIARGEATKTDHA